MTLRDRLRRAMGRSEAISFDSSRSTSTLNYPISTPTSIPELNPATGPLPPITLTKTTSSRLSKTFTFHGKAKREAKYQQRLVDWERRDAEEWNEPTAKRPGRKSQYHQDLLRSFEWSIGRKSNDGVPRRSASIWSGVSPGTSRIGSVDGGVLNRVLIESGNGRLGHQGLVGIELVH